MTTKSRSGQYARPAYNQAQKITARFGGPAQLAKLLGLSRVTLYRWQYARPVGSDGLIPTAQVERIKGIARVQGVLLRPEDWIPETIRYDDKQPTLGDLLG